MKMHTLFFLLCVTLFAANLQAQPQLLRVLDIEDGDTLVVEVSGNRERLQLAGIDAPEESENAKLKRDIEQSGVIREVLLSLGREATEHLQSLVKAGDLLQVRGALGKRDRYGRITAQVLNRLDRSLSEQMVQDGYAVALRRHAPDGELKLRLIEVEEKALAGHKGLWGKQRSAAMAWSGRKQ